MARYDDCEACNTYGENDNIIGDDFTSENGTHYVCDDCKIKFDDEMYEAVEQFKQEFTRDWVKGQRNKRQNAIDTAREESWYAEEGDN